MFWRRITVALIVLHAAMISLTGATNSAQASPQVSPNSPLLPPPKEGPKVILSETSIDGPAIVATYHPDTVLAWTGTDRLHHLNIMTSFDDLPDDQIDWSKYLPPPGFRVLLRRWVVERTFAWQSHSRRLSKD